MSADLKLMFMNIICNNNSSTQSLLTYKHLAMTATELAHFSPALRWQFHPAKNKSTTNEHLTGFIGQYSLL